MGANARQILQNFLARLKDQGITTIDEEDLELAIGFYIGADPRTIKKYRDLMEKLGIIQRTKDGKIKINYKTAKLKV